jgi:hypothetical protein
MTWAIDTAVGISRLAFVEKCVGCLRTGGVNDLESGSSFFVSS